MSVAVPGFLPVLSVGAHESAEEGACLMEFCSYMAGEQWSDRPRCTFPLLASIARQVNDLFLDDNRHRLALLAPALMKTGGQRPSVEHDRIGKALYLWLVKYAEAKMQPWQDLPSAYLLRNYYVSGMILEGHVSMCISVIANASLDPSIGTRDYINSRPDFDALYQMLADAIKEFQRLAGESSVADVDIAKGAHELGLQLVSA